MSVQLNMRNAEADESGEKALLHIRELLEGDVLDNRRQLMVITDHDPSLQSIPAILWILNSFSSSIKKTLT